MFAGDETGSAAKTTIRPIEPFGSWRLALGVVTPPAVQRATLEEQGGADARPIVESVPFDVENPPLDQSSTPPCKVFMSSAAPNRAPSRPLASGLYHCCLESAKSRKRIRQRDLESLNLRRIN